MACLHLEIDSIILAGRQQLLVPITLGESSKVCSRNKGEYFKQNNFLLSWRNAMYLRKEIAGNSLLFLKVKIKHLNKYN